MSAKPEKKDAAEDGGEGAPKKKLAGKTLVLFIILPAILVIGGGGAGAFFLLSGNGGGEAAAHGEETAEDDHGKGKEKGGDGHGEEGEGGGEGALAITEGGGVYFVAMPELLVNITGADGRPAFLKLKLTIEAPDSDTAHALEPELPRIIDQYQAFLRELRTDDMAGSGGAERVRMELLRRVNMVIAPAQANAVLIEEMLIQ